MAYPYAAGHPDYSSSGTYKFIPSVWTGKTQVKYYASTFLSQITNQDLEREIRGPGDSVIVRSVPNITVFPYYIWMKLPRERPTSAPVLLNIDKGYAFSIALNDVVAVQSDIPLLNKWTDDAAGKFRMAA